MAVSSQPSHLWIGDVGIVGLLGQPLILLCWPVEGKVTDTRPALHNCCTILVKATVAG